MTADLLGLPVEVAESMLAKAGTEYTVTGYRSKKPYEDADSRRVVRVKRNDAGIYELTVCEFKTKL
ncbi:hypothetical protein LJC56_05380 [Christensenellaceae bacterium OttesenSCG-928-K19]|nr:hypothetical protein [Christensenellaceae bacterium OttesenSCG-928-K19]